MFLTEKSNRFQLFCTELNPTFRQCTKLNPTILKIFQTLYWIESNHIILQNEMLELLFATQNSSPPSLQCVMMGRLMIDGVQCQVGGDSVPLCAGDRAVLWREKINLHQIDWEIWGICVVMWCDMSPGCPGDPTTTPDLTTIKNIQPHGGWITGIFSWSLA